MERSDQLRLPLEVGRRKKKKASMTVEEVARETLECDLYDPIVTALRAHPAVGKVRRATLNGSGRFEAYRKGGRRGKPEYVKIGEKGCTDITGHLKGGISFYIEVKRAGNSLEPHQRVYIEECSAHGCLAGVAHSVREALALVDAWVNGQQCES
jgi:hypothetical protein